MFICFIHIAAPLIVTPTIEPVFHQQNQKPSK